MNILDSKYHFINFQFNIKLNFEHNFKKTMVIRSLIEKNGNKFLFKNLADMWYKYKIS